MKHVRARFHLHVANLSGEYPEFAEAFSPDRLGRIRIQIGTLSAKLRISFWEIFSDDEIAATVLGPSIYYDAQYFGADTPEGVASLAHEVVHVGQYRDLGVLGFLGAYARDVIKFGIDDIYEEVGVERDAADLGDYILDVYRFVETDPWYFRTMTRKELMLR
jgi:hypothetical protein